MGALEVQRAYLHTALRKILSRVLRALSGQPSKGSLLYMQVIVAGENSKPICDVLQVLIIISGLLTTATFPLVSAPFADQEGDNGSRLRSDGLESHTCSRMFRGALVVSLFLSLITILNSFYIICNVRRFVLPTSNARLEEWAAEYLIFIYQFVWVSFALSVTAAMTAAVLAALQYVAAVYLIVAGGILVPFAGMHILTSLLNTELLHGKVQDSLPATTV